LTVRTRSSFFKKYTTRISFFDY